MARILVVEDDLNSRKLMCAVLKQSGFKALPADDGIEALALLEREHVDLVLVDIMMPRMDGFELTRQLRSAWPELPILMVTARQEQRDKRQGFALGIDDYLVKPVDEEELVWRIKALLRRARIASDRRLRVGDVTLDLDALTVSRNGGRGGESRIERVALPQKEFLLLFKLLSYPDIIFTRMQLMDEIWGVESETDGHSLNVHISRLRDRFRDWPEFEITTVRGLGYRGSWQRGAWREQHE